MRVQYRMSYHKIHEITLKHWAGQFTQVAKFSLLGTVLFHLIHITNKMFTKPNYATLHSHYYIIFAKTRNKFYLSYMSLFKYVRSKPISRLNCLLALYDSKMTPFFLNKHSIGENRIAHHYFRLRYNIATVSLLCKPQLYKSRRIFFLYPDPTKFSYH